MTYFVACLIEDGHWAETMGDRDRECVDFEIQCWKDSRKRGSFRVIRKAFAKVPRQAELVAWVDSQLAL